MYTATVMQPIFPATFSPSSCWSELVLNDKEPGWYFTLPNHAQVVAVQNSYNSKPLSKTHEKHEKEMLFVQWHVTEGAG